MPILIAMVTMGIIGFCMNIHCTKPIVNIASKAIICKIPRALSHIQLDIFSYDLRLLTYQKIENIVYEGLKQLRAHIA
jgi:hypothetical protein